jgi:predicted AAA+ superfamily ATPase
MGPGDQYVNLLLERTHYEYLRNPGLFRSEVLAHQERHPRALCVVDEVQRIPELLNEVHDLIESRGIRFVLTGSSARKLRRGAANLLAGRARAHHLFPLLASELGRDFDLERALRVGLLPWVWSQATSHADEREFLSTYAHTYVREEIQAEGTVRALGPFVRFLDIAAADDGLTVNASTVARDCGVSVKTVQSYYEILEDTFLAFRLDAHRASVRKRLVAHPRYVFFDMGITNALAGELTERLGASVRGRRFEQFVITQARATLSYAGAAVDLRYWRTTTGAEVDLLLCRGQKVLCAVEVKSSERELRDLSGLEAFHEDQPRVPLLAVAPIERPRRIGPIEVVPWTDFLARLPGLVGA